MTVVACLTATLGCLALVAPSAALADGDPASDILVDRPPLFLSPASGADAAQAAVLERQLHVAAAGGHRLLVAVIATRADLGSVTDLWGAPQTYAEFLGRELPRSYHGELLVVMPHGFGVSRDGAAVSSALGRLAPRPGELITATEQAIASLTGVAPGAADAVSVAQPDSRIAGLGWWLTSVLALLAIAGLWAVSLHVRPPRARVLRRGH